MQEASRSAGVSNKAQSFILPHCLSSSISDEMKDPSPMVQQLSKVEPLVSNADEQVDNQTTREVALPTTKETSVDNSHTTPHLAKDQPPVLDISSFVNTIMSTSPLPLNSTYSLTQYHERDGRSNTTRNEPSPLAHTTQNEASPLAHTAQYDEDMPSLCTQYEEVVESTAMDDVSCYLELEDQCATKGEQPKKLKNVPDLSAFIINLPPSDHSTRPGQVKFVAFPHQSLLNKGPDFLCEVSYVCEVCGVVLDSESSLDHHRQSHEPSSFSGAVPGQMTEYEQQFMLNIKLQAERSKNGKNKRRLYQRNRQLKDDNGIDMGYLISEYQNELESKPGYFGDPEKLICPICQVKFVAHQKKGKNDTLRRFRLHRNKHFDIKPLQCRFCLFRCKEQFTLDTHEKQKHDASQL